MPWLLTQWKCNTEVSRSFVTKLSLKFYLMVCKDRQNRFLPFKSYRNFIDHWTFFRGRRGWQSIWGRFRTCHWMGAAENHNLTWPSLCLYHFWLFLTIFGLKVLLITDFLLWRHWQCFEILKRSCFVLIYFVTRISAKNAFWKRSLFVHRFLLRAE